MIKFLVLVNKQGQTRLARYYEDLVDVNGEDRAVQVRARARCGRLRGVCPRAHTRAPKHARAARHAHTLRRLLAAGSAAAWLTIECCDWAWPHRRRTSCANV
jgi:hypothetical protein